MFQFRCRALALTFVLTFFAMDVMAQAGLAVVARTDREDALYNLNEPVTFTLVVTKDGTALTEGTLSYNLSVDGASTVDSGTRDLSESPVLITGTLAHPGFLRCTATYVTEDETKIHGVAAGGFEPLKIKASMAPPEDFDTFWAEKKAALAEVPMNPVLTPVPSPVEGVETFDLQLDCLGGAPVSGYYCRPSGVAEKSLPAVLWVHGAGVRSSALRPDIAAEGMLVLDINAHGIPNGKPSEYYADLANGDLADYRLRDREDRETYYFLGMYYRLIRAMDFLTAQPEWDGKVLIARGSSQGGGQSLVAAGIDPRVTALIANVPAMCDHTGVINGWPRLVPRDDQGNPDPTIQQVARYFDAMNFATRTQADALVSVGFIDNTCRPTSVYAAYNNLQGEKHILNKPLMTHAVPPEWNDMALKMMKDHIAKVKQ